MLCLLCRVSNSEAFLVLVASFYLSQTFLYACRTQGKNSLLVEEELKTRATTTKKAENWALRHILAVSRVRAVNLEGAAGVIYRGSQLTACCAEGRHHCCWSTHFQPWRSKHHCQRRRHAKRAICRVRRYTSSRGSGLDHGAAICWRGQPVQRHLREPEASQKNEGKVTFMKLRCEYSWKIVYCKLQFI